MVLNDIRKGQLGFGLQSQSLSFKIEKNSQIIDDDICGPFCFKFFSWLHANCHSTTCLVEIRDYITIQRTMRKSVNYQHPIVQCCQLLADFSGKSSKKSADIDTDICLKFSLILIKLNKKMPLTKEPNPFLSGRILCPLCLDYLETSW